MVRGKASVRPMSGIEPLLDGFNCFAQWAHPAQAERFKSRDFLDDLMTDSISQLRSIIMEVSPRIPRAQEIQDTWNL
jgi:hypothetical protein